MPLKPQADRAAARILTQEEPKEESEQIGRSEVRQVFLAGVTDGRFCDGVPKARLTLATGAPVRPSPDLSVRRRKPVVSVAEADPTAFFFNPPQGRPLRRVPLRGTERRGTWGVRGPRACARG